MWHGRHLSHADGSLGAPQWLACGVGLGHVAGSQLSAVQREEKQAAAYNTTIPAQDIS